MAEKSKYSAERKWNVHLNKNGVVTASYKYGYYLIKIRSGHKTFLSVTARHIIIEASNPITFNGSNVNELLLVSRAGSVSTEGALVIRMTGQTDLLLTKLIERTNFSLSPQVAFAIFPSEEQTSSIIINKSGTYKKVEPLSAVVANEVMGIAALIQTPSSSVMGNLNIIKKLVQNVVAKRAKKKNLIARTAKKKIEKEKKKKSLKEKHDDDLEEEEDLKGLIDFLYQGKRSSSTLTGLINVNWLDPRVAAYHEDQQMRNQYLGEDLCRAIVVNSLIYQRLCEKGMADKLWKVASFLSGKYGSYRSLSRWKYEQLLLYLYPTLTIVNYYDDDSLISSVREGRPAVVFSAGHVELTTTTMTRPKPLSLSLTKTYSEVFEFKPPTDTFSELLAQLRCRYCHPTKPNEAAYKYIHYKPGQPIQSLDYPMEIAKWSNMMQEENTHAINDYCSAITLAPYISRIAGNIYYCTHYKSIEQLHEFWVFIHDNTPFLSKCNYPGKAAEILNKIYDANQAVNLTPSPSEFKKLIMYIGLPCEYAYLTYDLKGEELIFFETSGLISSYHVLMSKGHIELFTYMTPLGLPIPRDVLNQYTTALPY
jgi:hypothetical protein